MTYQADRFSECLHTAEEQLHWGTDSRALDQAAQALARLAPGHVLLEQLAQRAGVLRAARRELARRSAMRPPPPLSKQPPARFCERRV